jgi:16S rRNA (guanine966-N2)-methyltransferase
MRIVGGQWRGRRLAAPKGQATRPTSDRVREALFDALSARLGPDLGGGAVLDLFAGTGALGLEALSRGAASAVFVECDRDALSSLRANIDALGATQRCVVVPGDALGAGLAAARARGPFALLLVDPPYRMESASVAAAVEELDGAGAVEADAFLAIEHATTSEAIAPHGFEIVRTYMYGDTSVTLTTRREGVEGRA